MAVSHISSSFLGLFFFMSWFAYLYPEVVVAINGCPPITRHYKFNIRMQNVTRLCETKSIITVNGKFPGPPVVAREGDRVVIKVVNHVPNNITIHWHGIRQLRNGWADGPAYITQCPIRSGQSYIYNYTITGQRGTLWYHAHISWIRATLYGAIIILPKCIESYPFVKPYKNVPIIFGEWWKADPEAVVNQAIMTGSGPNNSDSYTINGLPGPSINCSSNEMYRLKVKPGKTYLLRLINAALDEDLFFKIANHTFTVVETDASYVKPFETDTVYISSGQTSNILLKTKTLPSKPVFLMAARPYSAGPTATFDTTTVIGVLEYEDGDVNGLPIPTFPPFNASEYVANWTNSLRGLGPSNVPQTIERRYFFELGLGTIPCPRNQTCQGPTNQTKFVAGINNISFTMPTTALLEAHYFKRSNGVYTTDFPSKSLDQFDYTASQPSNTMLTTATKVVVLPFNTTVELVMQGTSAFGPENHPLHLHGFNFFVVGQGSGSFNSTRDPPKFNLVDPIERNTVGVPSEGWVAIRFRADNPGVWFMHCHIEIHMTWGLRMAWVVMDGNLQNQKLLPPPDDLPHC